MALTPGVNTPFNPLNSCENAPYPPTTLCKNFECDNTVIFYVQKWTCFFQEVKDTDGAVIGYKKLWKCNFLELEREQVIDALCSPSRSCSTEPVTLDGCGNALVCSVPADVYFAKMLEVAYEPCSTATAGEPFTCLPSPDNPTVPTRCCGLTQKCAEKWIRLNSMADMPSTYPCNRLMTVCDTPLPANQSKTADLFSY